MFVTELKSQDVFLRGIRAIEGVPQEGDIETSNEFVRIHWDMEIESRRWGIKDIITSITKIEISIDWNHSGDGDEESSGHYEETVTDDSWTINNEIEIERTITPSDIEINFRTKKIIVS